MSLKEVGEITAKFADLLHEHVDDWNDTDVLAALDFVRDAIIRRTMASV